MSTTLLQLTADLTRQQFAREDDPTNRATHAMLSYVGDFEQALTDAATVSRVRQIRERMEAIKELLDEQWMRASRLEDEASGH